MFWEVLKDFWDYYSFIILFIIGTAFIAFRMPKRSYFLVRVICCVVALIALSFGLIKLERALGWDFFLLVGGGKYVVQYVAVCASVIICYECDVFASSFCATIGYAVQHIAQRMSDVMGRLLGGLLPIFDFLIIVSVFALGLLAIYFLSIRRQKFAYTNIKIESPIQLIATAVLLLSTIFIEMQFFNLRIGGEAMMYERLFSSICALMVIVLEINTLVKKRIADDFKKLQKLLNEEREKYVQEKANVEMINLKCHDIRHQLRAMEGRIDAEALRELSDTINIYNTQIKTGNEAIDVVLATQGLYCLNNDIRLTCLLDGKKLNFMPDHELYAFFGNAIENAIHAVEKLDKEKRVISIAEKRTEGFVNISFTNYFEENLTFEEGLPVSKQGENHGFGTRSMRMIVEKYGGRLNVTAQDDLFMLDAFFPLQDA